MSVQQQDFTDSHYPDNWPVDSDWKAILSKHLECKAFRRLIQFVEAERKTKTIYPDHQDVFRAFKVCPFQDTRVIILGQDPYHGPGQAHGLSFSVANDQKLPPSLRNIFRELKVDLGIENSTGDLTKWAQQGVLLLNTVLTVESGKAHSHKNQGWETFTDFVIEKIGERKSPAIFLLWGSHAAKKQKLIGAQHVKLVSPHPSPLSAHRGFFGSQPFSKTNQALLDFGESPIDWSL